MIRAAAKMWSGVQESEPQQPRRSSINLKPWWSQGAAETHAATRSGVRACDSRLVDTRWVLEGPAPAWFRGAEHLRQGTPLALSDAFRVTQLLSAGDADELGALRRAEGRPGPGGCGARLHSPCAVQCVRLVACDARRQWAPRVAVSSRRVGAHHLLAISVASRCGGTRGRRRGPRRPGGGEMQRAATLGALGGLPYAKRVPPLVSLSGHSRPQRHSPR